MSGKKKYIICMFVCLFFVIMFVCVIVGLVFCLFIILFFSSHLHWKDNYIIIDQIMIRSSWTLFQISKYCLVISLSICKFVCFSHKPMVGRFFGSGYVFSSLWSNVSMVTSLFFLPFTDEEPLARIATKYTTKF